MIRDGHISTFQLSAIIFALVLGKGLDSAVLILIHWGHSAPELLVLIAEGSFLAVMGLILSLLKADDKNLIDLMYELFGPWLAAPLALVLFLFLLADVGVNLQYDMEQIKTVFLPTTPLAAVLFLTLFGMTIPVYYGIENLARTNLLMMVGMLGLATVLLPLSLRGASLANLPPIFGPGIPTLFKEGILHAGFFGEYMAVLMLRPYVRSYALFRKGFWRGAVLCVGVGFISIVDTQLVFPYPTDDHLFFPFIESARLLYFGRFIQHIEAPFAVTWLLLALARLSILVYILSIMAASIARANNYRRFVPLTSVALYYIAIVIPSLAYAIDFKDIVLEKRGLPFYGGIAVLIIAVGYWKRWRQNKQHGGAAGQGGRRAGESKDAKSRPHAPQPLP